MKNRAERLLESKDLQLYKRVLKILGDYSMNVPMTGVDPLFDVAIGQGVKILPKDKNAIEILGWVFDCESSAAAVHRMLNIRFSDLPVGIRPVMKVGRKHAVASWSINGVVSDRVKDLIDWAATGKHGVWSDIDGNKVDLIDTAEENN